jgi:hypothetical protein
LIIENMLMAQVKDDGSDAHDIAESVLDCVRKLEGMITATAEVRAGRGQPSFAPRLNLSNAAEMQ